MQSKKCLLKFFAASLSLGLAFAQTLNADSQRQIERSDQEHQNNDTFGATVHQPARVALAQLRQRTASPISHTQEQVFPETPAIDVEVQNRALEALREGAPASPETTTAPPLTAIPAVAIPDAQAQTRALEALRQSGAPAGQDRSPEHRIRIKSAGQPPPAITIEPGAAKPAAAQAGKAPDFPEMPAADAGVQSRALEALRDKDSQDRAAALKARADRAAAERAQTAEELAARRAQAVEVRERERLAEQAARAERAEAAAAIRAEDMARRTAAWEGQAGTTRVAQAAAAPAAAVSEPETRPAPLVAAVPESELTSNQREAQERALDALRRHQVAPERREPRVSAQPVAPAPRIAAQPAPDAAEPAPRLDPERERLAVEALRRQIAGRDGFGDEAEPPAVSAENLDSALELLRKQTEELTASEAEARAAERAARRAKADSKRDQAAVISAPAPTVEQPEPVVEMTERERRLSDLLRRYRADEITPSEYHRERAQIIADY